MKLFKAGLLLGVGLLVTGFCSLAVHASYQCLELNGSGYAYIADGSQAGLNMGLSDFMVEVRVKTTKTGVQSIIQKKDRTSYGWAFSLYTGGYLNFKIYTSGADAQSRSDIAIPDGRWHYVVVAVDRSSATGVKLFIAGSEVSYERQQNATAAGDLDNTKNLWVGIDQNGDYFTGQIDCVRVWNFGYGGLPADYATYIAWRATARNVFLDISNYNSGSWNRYADADRTEVLDDSGLEAWTGDLLDDWTETGLSGGVRDLFDENGTGDHIFHGGSHAAKFQATNAGGVAFQVTQSITLVANKYYEVLGWMYYPTRTAGSIDMLLWNATDGVYAQVALTGTNADYAEYSVVGKPTVTGNIIYMRMQDETDTGIAYFDDISVKRTGLVGHWKFENGYLDEGSNDNDLTAGGSGNTFPGYTLKRQKIISPASVN